MQTSPNPWQLLNSFINTYHIHLILKEIMEILPDPNILEQAASIVDNEDVALKLNQYASLIRNYVNEKP